MSYVLFALKKKNKNYFLINWVTEVVLFSPFEMVWVYFHACALLQAGPCFWILSSPTCTKQDWCLCVYSCSEVSCWLSRGGVTTARWAFKNLSLVLSFLTWHPHLTWQIIWSVEPTKQPQKKLQTPLESQRRSFWQQVFLIIETISCLPSTNTIFWKGDDGNTN